MVGSTNTTISQRGHTSNWHSRLAGSSSSSPSSFSASNSSSATNLTNFTIATTTNKLSTTHNDESPTHGTGNVTQQRRAETTDPKRLTFAIGTGLDAGIKRKNRPNEDNLLVIQGTHTYNTRAYPFGLFVVADGMGGHSKGQEASRLAIQHIREIVMPALLSNAEIDSDHARELLLDALHHANLAVHQHNQQQHIDMGTTVTAAIMIDTTIAVANVGDSRTYLYRAQDGLKQVTKDHSLVGQLLARGEISEDDVYTHPQRNEIYRCIGEKATVQADTFILPLEAETTLLLCSDGLWEMVRKPHIEQI